MPMTSTAGIREELFVMVSEKLTSEFDFLTMVDIFGEMLCTSYKLTAKSWTITYTDGGFNSTQLLMKF